MNNMDDNKLITTSVVNVSELRIGDKVCFKGHEEPLFVVGIFAAPDAVCESKDHTGSVYMDFPGNPGDVLEAEIDEIYKILDK